MPPVPAEHVVGIDLGGTNIRAAIVDSDGSIVGQTACAPSRAEEGEEQTLGAVVVAVKECLSGFDGAIARVGLAIPGHTNDREGVVHWSPNFGVRIDGVLHYWKDVDVRTPLENGLGLKVSMANDANAAALGEYRFGSGKDSARCLVMLTLGTGIGGGVVLGPQSLGGATDRAHLLLGGNLGGAELGHTVIARGGLDSTSGAYGTVEAYCQRDSIVRRAQHKLVRGRPSRMMDLVKGDIGAISPSVVTKAADQGDAVAQEVWREVGGYLGTAIGSLINVFAPDVFAIGGQVALAGDWLLEPAIDEAKKVAIPSLFKDCRVTVAEKIADAGILGAAAVALASS
jgi:glucokinase